MSWCDLIALIEEEVGTDAAARIANLARARMGGERITIAGRAAVTAADIRAAAPGRPVDVAKALGVHPSTVYRAMRRKQAIIR
jgi:transcriptional regulator of acetoin/glycerol metabolism